MYNLLKAMHILYFYPRPPRGGRRLRDQQARHAEGISIHALREEGDIMKGVSYYDELHDFYPRPPRGGRQLVINSLVMLRVISIHALREEGDYSRSGPTSGREISIHALREEGDYLLPAPP